MAIKIFKIPAVKYGLLAGATIFIIKSVIYLTGNIAFRLNPVYSIGTASLIILSLTLAFREKNENAFINYLGSGILLVAVCMAFSGLCDQVFYRVNPQIPQIITDISLNELKELDAKLNQSIFENNKEEFANINPKDMVGPIAYVLYVLEMIVFNILSILGVSLFFWLRENRLRKEFNDVL